MYNISEAKHRRKISVIECKSIHHKRKKLIICISSKLKTFIHCIPKWDWQRRLREEEKKKRVIMNTNEIHHTCVGTMHNKTLCMERVRLI
jgi:hypothetical protein